MGTSSGSWKIKDAGEIAVPVEAGVDAMVGAGVDWVDGDVVGEGLDEGIVTAVGEGVGLAG